MKKFVMKPHIDENLDESKFHFCSCDCSGF